MFIPSAANAAKRFLTREALRLSKHSPAILTTVGIAGVIAGSVMAARATLKLERVVDEFTEHKELVSDRISSGELSSDEGRRDLAIVYTHEIVKIVKLYAPSVIIGVGGIACIVGGHRILNKRNVALAAAYKAVESTYNKYRGRVIEEFGEEKDNQILRDITAPSVINRTTTTDENGEERAIAITNSDHSQYARFFDEYNENWRGEANNLNLLFLKSVQNYVNDRLYAVGHVFLNEVYERLGFRHTSAGAVVGWVVQPGGSNYIDFGIFNKDSEAARAFVNGDEPSILLDFNVDGLIFDKIS